MVDATGRGSRLPEWLRALGYDAPAEERVQVGIYYTTRTFTREPSHLGGMLGAIVPPTPDGKRGGVMLAMEGGRWTVTLIAQFVSAAPADLDGFRAFTASLPSRRIHDVVSIAEPLDEAVQSPFPASIRRRYERLARFPEGLVAIGDALCGFNPIYGQGMSVATLEALALDETLRSTGTSRLGLRFFRKAAPIIDAPGLEKVRQTAVGSDLRVPETVGPRSTVVNLVNAYVARLHRAAHKESRARARVPRRVEPGRTTGVHLRATSCMACDARRQAGDSHSSHCGVEFARTSYSVDECAAVADRRRPSKRPRLKEAVASARST
ncbi:MAG: hypothetical protein QM736_11995 [Vicinamibacterales bacterium]